MASNQTAEVRNHLRNHGSITSWEAIQLYGATRLSAIIFNLKKKGMKIESEKFVVTNRYGIKSSAVRYIYKEG